MTYAPDEDEDQDELDETPRRTSPYRAWAELLARTFALDVLTCGHCQGRMRLLAVVKDPASVERYLLGVGEPAAAPVRSPRRGPPYWRSLVLRRMTLGDDEA